MHRRMNLVSHDLDTGSEQTLHQWHNHGDGRSGRKMYVLEFSKRIALPSFRLMIRDTRRAPSWIPCNFLSDGGAPLEIESDNAPFVSIYFDRPSQLLSHTLIFDTQSRIFYKFPQPTPEPVLLGL